jgi:hypothetical protein
LESNILEAVAGTTSIIIFIRWVCAVASRSNDLDIPILRCGKMTRLTCALATRFAPDGRWIVAGGTGDLKQDVRALAAVRSF